MSTVELVDLDALISPDRRVKLAGKTWRVPGDPPTGWLLAFRHLTRKFDSDEPADELAVVEELADAVVDLFALKAPDSEQEIREAVDTLGVAALVQVVNAIYARETGTAPEAEEAPDPTPAAGTPSTSRARQRRASRSSSSSAS